MSLNFINDIIHIITAKAENNVNNKIKLKSTRHHIQTIRITQYMEKGDNSKNGSWPLKKKNTHIEENDRCNVWGIDWVYRRAINLCGRTPAFYWFHIRSILSLVIQSTDEGIRHLLIVVGRLFILFNVTAWYSGANCTAGIYGNHHVQSWTWATMSQSIHSCEVAAAVMLVLQQCLIKSFKKTQFPAITYILFTPLLLLSQTHKCLFPSDKMQWIAYKCVSCC